ncbi:DNA repair exonuclease [Lentilactobacillus sp. Marseille-Q4993]|uniref:metallophosphoesterase family protein n=1 Tax=Lentilactobacillus sp. Marseille-Q4993 TaxID=3039492 RepID=UPI0024BCEC2D|nr:DNA repair exonuclease [Lentilactobacillus sp. Marseille-Q4993]
MKFIHAADIHLDSPFSGLLAGDTLPAELTKKITDSTFDSFKNVVNTAIDDRVDFVLLAGDLFDRNEKSVSAAAFLTDQLNRLNDANIKVFIIFGNHDYLSMNQDSSSLGYPDNVYVFPNDVTTTQFTLEEGKTVAITGFSFGTQWINDSVINDYPTRTSADFQIGMLHGSADSVDSPEANYAPFTLSDLKAKNYDYWALGHIHKRQDLDDSGVINYSGNTQGRSINESGDKGFYEVTEQAGKLTKNFIASSVINWERMAIDLSGTSISNVNDVVFGELQNAQFNKLTLVRLMVTVDGNTDSEVLDALNSGELLATVQSRLARNWQELNAYVTSLKVTMKQSKINSPLDQAFFDQASDEILNPEMVAQFASELRGKDFITESLHDEEFANQIIEQAKLALSEKLNYGNGSDEQ